MSGPPNILLIILDALREDTADHSADDPDRTLRARTCVSSAPWTLPSCTSILSGVAAHRHRHFWRVPPIESNPLLQALPDAYRTIGIVNNGAISKGSGAETGFDKWIFTRDHDEPFQRARRLIRKAGRKRPVFMVLHSNIVHDYCLPVATRYAPPGGPPVLGDRVITWRDTDESDRTAALRTYQACATAQAAQVRSVLEAVRDRDDFVTAVTSDHGEGFDFGQGRIHHGGRVHHDLVSVPLAFDLPSSVPADRRDSLRQALDSQVLAGTDVVPTLFDLAGHRVPDVDGVPAGRLGPRTVVSEDRRYFYLNDRFRLNYDGFHKHMSDADVERNRQLLGQLATGPVVRSFLRHPHKLIVTALHLASGTSAGDAAPRLRQFHALPARRSGGGVPRPGHCSPSSCSTWTATRASSTTSWTMAGRGGPS